MFQREVVEKIRTHFMISKFFLPKSYRLLVNVEKYCRAGRATDENMTHAHFILDN